MKVFVVALILMLLPVVVLSSDRSITVRDRSGNIIGTEDVDR
jgi:hypothetical protein